MDPDCCRDGYMVGLDTRLRQRDRFLGATFGLGSAGLPQPSRLVGYLGDFGAGLRLGHDSRIRDRVTTLATPAEARDHSFVGKQELLLVWVLSNWVGVPRRPSSLPRMRSVVTGKKRPRMIRQ